MSEPEPAKPVDSVRPETPPLDDVMLAMDVVDTLRRQERLAQRELDEAGRAEDLKERLRKIYAQQGIDVPDRVLEQGVAALREERFVYKPPEKGLATRLAHIYVRRGRWGKWLGGGVGVAALGLTTNYFAVVAPNAALPKELETMHGEMLTMAKSDYARSRVDSVFKAGESAVRDANTDAAKQSLADLGDLRSALEQEYTIQVVNRPGARSGFWRVPDINTRARNYYIVVEAVDAKGNGVRVPIKNEETGKTEQVKVWGLRVDEDTFNAVARDKQDNGIIEHNRFGYKKRGYLKPEYEMPTSGGAITTW